MPRAGVAGPASLVSLALAGVVGLGSLNAGLSAGPPRPALARSPTSPTSPTIAARVAPAATAAQGGVYHCPLGVWHVGAVDTPSGWFTIYGHWPMVASLGYDVVPPYPAQAQYAMGATWYISIPPGTMMKADYANARCTYEWIGPVELGGWWIYQLINMQLKNRISEGDGNVCPDGTYADDPSYCVSDGLNDGGGTGGYGPGGGPVPPPEMYYTCNFSWWSDGSITVNWCVGPFSY